MNYEAGSYDIAVIGAGHAGIEAALAAARLGLNTLCFTVNLDAVGNMPCNPAIGGTGKGHLVRELDALGGEMARAADQACIQYRLLNRGKGPAVWSLRAQADRRRYQEIMKHTLEQQERLWVKQAEITDIYAEGGRVTAVRTAYGNLASWVGIFCNLLLCAGKFLAGTLSGSISIAADAVNNLSDASSSVVSLIGFKLGARPADDEHPYGHARFEYLAGLAVAVMVLVIGVELLKSSVDKILHPAAVTFSWVAMAVLAASIAVKLWMSVFNRTLGKRINSGSLIATAADSRNDVLTTSAVLVASLISHFANVELDGWMGAAVALFILYSGVGSSKTPSIRCWALLPTRSWCSTSTTRS